MGFNVIEYLKQAKQHTNSLTEDMTLLNSEFGKLNDGSINYANLAFNLKGQSGNKELISYFEELAMAGDNAQTK